MAKSRSVPKLTLGALVAFLGLLLGTIPVAATDDSGDATVTGGTLRIVGADSSDVISVVVGPETVTVEIDKEKPQEFSAAGLSGITVLGRGGDDLVRILNEVDAEDSKALQLHVRGDAGDDVLDVVGRWNSVSIRGGSGDDQVYVGSEATSTRVSGRLLVIAAGGSDSIVVSNADVIGSARIRGGVGADTVALSDSSVHGNLLVRTGAMDDVVSITTTDVGPRARFVGGRGTNDQLLADAALEPKSISGFESIEIPESSPIKVSKASRTASVAAALNGAGSGPPPLNVDESAEDSASTEELGAWNVVLVAEVPLSRIDAFASNLSDIGESGGVVAIDVTADNATDFYTPANRFGTAIGEATYSVTFEALTDSTLTLDGLLQTRHFRFDPKGKAELIITRVGPTRAVVFSREISRTSPKSPEDSGRLLQEVLDGTSVQLEAGASYTIEVNTVAAYDLSLPCAAETLATVTWGVS